MEVYTQQQGKDLATIKPQSSKDLAAVIMMPNHSQKEELNSVGIEACFEVA